MPLLVPTPISRLVGQTGEHAIPFVRVSEDHVGYKKRKRKKVTRRPASAAALRCCRAFAAVTVAVAWLVPGALHAVIAISARFGE